ncbi:hypothetical protein P692DRAFT_20879790 [Suillus brevipes Sb2]|nr:hypothetical protein P692DRAFT_20879790 [Suillus brevipes Sb2]
MVSTRSQAAKVAKLEARVTTVAARARAVTPLLFLSTKLQLGDFLASSRAAKRVALGVESLHITIKDKSVSVTALHQCLLCTKNLTDLELALPRLSTVGWVCLFRDLYLPRLRYIRTNAPHTTLAAFLMRHPRITYLSVERCNRSKQACDLGVVSLPSLSAITGPISCIASAIPSQLLTYVSISCYTQRDFSTPLLDFTTKLSPLHASRITQLSVPFDVGDIHFARYIAGAMPRLILLEAIEKPCQQHVIRSHAWSNVVEWSRHLALMRNLKTLGLLTSTFLARNDVHERALVIAWTVHHPSLKRLALWHGFGSPGHKMHYWYFFDGVWSKHRGYVDPVFDFFSISHMSARSSS